MTFHRSLNYALGLGIFLAVSATCSGQDPAKPPPDEFKLLLKEVQRAYRRPEQVEQDVLAELRKQYTVPKPDREADILRLVRRAYVTSKVIEARIVREMQEAYKNPTVEQEERVLEAIRRGGALPPRTLPADVVAERAARMFRKFDRDRDGRLSADEMPEGLREQLSNWDGNRDGVIDADEYLAYFQASLKAVAAGIASGEVPLNQPKGKVAVPQMPTALPSPSGHAAAPAPKVPDWFRRLDEDADGQVGLYEWKKAGRPVAEFLAIDRNGDGFIEVKELLAYMSEHPEWRPGR
jgi:Ca2+-binding EF-hand superfamily protein